SVLFFGDHGINTYGYGEALTYNDPYRGGKGDHSLNGDYAYQVWAYDVNDFIAVKNGLKQPWDIKPYDVWNINFPQFDGAKHIGGVAFDPATGRLYVAQEGGDKTGFGYGPLIQVFQLSLNPPGTPVIQAKTAPQIGSLTAGPTSVVAGGNVTLTAGNVRDSN